MGTAGSILGREGKTFTSRRVYKVKFQGVAEFFLVKSKHFSGKRQY